MNTMLKCYRWRGLPHRMTQRMTRHVTNSIKNDPRFGDRGLTVRRGHTPYHQQLEIASTPLVVPYFCGNIINRELS